MLFSHSPQHRFAFSQLGGGALTPALESVVRGIVKDSEDSTARLLFKMVVDINLITRIICRDFDYSEADLRRRRQEAVRIVSDTNGMIHLGENTDAWHD